MNTRTTPPPASLVLAFAKLEERIASLKAEAARIVKESPNIGQAAARINAMNDQLLDVLTQAE